MWDADLTTRMGAQTAARTGAIAAFVFAGLGLLGAVLAPPGKAEAAIAALDADIAKYKAQSPQLSGKAEAQERAYDTLRFRHDQFNAADAGVATAISLAAVAALMEAVALLWAAWGFGAFGIFMGLNAFLGGSFQLGILSSLLG